jgi:hypothetical protein
MVRKFCECAGWVFIQDLNNILKLSPSVPAGHLRNATLHVQRAT